MDIKPTGPVQPIYAATAGGSRREAPPSAPQVRNDTTEVKPEVTGALRDGLLEAAEIPQSQRHEVRIQLDIDSDSGRVVAEVRDRSTGDLVKELPSRTVLRQAAMLDEVLGLILDKPA